MGLRTNTKKARKNIIDYIMTDSDYIQERAEYEKKIPDDRACEILTYMIFRECRTAYEKRKEV